MPNPLPGTTSVGEYPDRFTADLVAAHLEGYGIEAAVLADPARHVAPHHVTDHGVVVVVRDEVVDEAREVLADLDLSAPALRHFADRPFWVRHTTLLLLATFAGPPAIAACYFAWVFLTSIGR